MARMIRGLPAFVPEDRVLDCGPMRLVSMPAAGLEIRVTNRFE
jgi:hypothetical protein